MPGAVDEVIRYEAITFGDGPRWRARTASSAACPFPPACRCRCASPQRAATLAGTPTPTASTCAATDARSPAFGAGIHYCLGAALAKAELEEALSVLVGAVGRIELLSEPRWVPYAAIRCYEPPVEVALIPH